MKIEVEITKGRFFIILAALLLISGLIAVTAYNSMGSGGNPATFGHSVDELDWSKSISQVITGKLNLGNRFVLSGIGDNYANDTTLRIYLANGTQAGLGSEDVYVTRNLCIGSDCRSSWPSSTTTLHQSSCYWANTGGGGVTGDTICNPGYYVAGIGVRTTNDNREWHKLYCCLP